MLALQVGWPVWFCFCRLALVELLLLLVLSFHCIPWQQLTHIAVAEDDVVCLKAVRNLVVDVNYSLPGWVFYHNDSDMTLCSFDGVECSNDTETTVVGLTLEEAGLSGSFPSPLSACMSLEYLSLANNSFTGPLPSDLCHHMPYLTTLDLSNNEFAGEIPGDLHNCQYLNSLHLENNQFSGSIPWGIGILPRLRDLDLSNNSLSGPIPSSFTNRSLILQKPFSNSSIFYGNPNLCGPPLSIPCSTKPLIKLNNLVLPGASVLFVILFIASIIASGFACRRSACRRTSTVIPEMFGANLMRVTWEDLRLATADFSESNIVGVGGSCTVYKAKLGSSETVAVKVFEYSSLDESLQSSDVHKQFLTELGVLAKLRHRNLVKILSYCYNLTSTALVLDYMAMGSLEALLHNTNIPSRHVTHDSNELRPFVMNWKARLQILLSIAQGLEYLHQEYDGKCCVIHGDLKPGNVLLDEYMEAHIADFGLARLVSAVDTASFITPSRRVVTAEQGWSFGYTAPECMQQGVVSRKSDVFSFGVTALEVITGERPSSSRLGEGQTLAEWVGLAIASGTASAVVASTSRKRDWSKRAADITTALRLACCCAAKMPSHRPDMHQVASCLRVLTEHDLSEDIAEA